MSKQPKTQTPTDADLKGNPLIGGAKGTTMANAKTREVEASTGVNTVEGDTENDTNQHGGIDKSVGRAGQPRTS